jgi:hypothetical protein
MGAVAAGAGRELLVVGPARRRDGRQVVDRADEVEDTAQVADELDS